jgi:HAD superfamily hydrolase (TIGR01509 family)
LNRNITAIFFDFDGTLVDSESLHYEAWSAAVVAHGAGTGWDDYQRRFVGKSDRWAGRAFLEEAGHSPDETIIDEVCRIKHAYYRERSGERLRIELAVAQWLLSAPRELAIAVVSSSPTVDVEPTLLQSGVRDRLDALICGDHVKRLKPDPEPYLTALERVGRRPEEALVFEDSSTGLASARAAGIEAVHVDQPARLLELLGRIR